MKKIFIDIGGHLGESIEKFYNEIPDAKDWLIFSFEPLTYKELIENTLKYDNVYVVPVAAWIDNKDLVFYFGKRKEGLGSTALKGKLTGDIDYEKAINVKAMDIKDFLEVYLSGAKYTIMKINIEGGEYTLLPYLIESNLLNLVNELYVETHADKFESVIKERFQKIESDVLEKLKKFNTKVCFYINRGYTFDRKEK